MAITFGYVTETAVPAGVRDQILRAAAALLQTRSWWSEPIRFIDEPSGKLVGVTKLFLGNYSTPSGGYQEVDYREDLFMARFDGQYIVAKLEEWSRTFGLTWTVDIAGEKLGRIVGGQSDPSIATVFAELLSVSGFPDGNDTSTLAKALDEKYASRNRGA